MASLGKSHELSRPNSTSTNLEEEGPPSAHRGYLRHFRLPLSLPRSSLLLSFPAFKRGNISLQRRRISLTTSARAHSAPSSVPPTTDREGETGEAESPQFHPRARGGRIYDDALDSSAQVHCVQPEIGEQRRMEWYGTSERAGSASWDQRPLLPASLSSSPLSLLGENLPSQCASGESESAF